MSLINKFRQAFKKKPVPQAMMFGLKVGLAKNDKVPEDTLLVVTHSKNFDLVRERITKDWLNYLKEAVKENEERNKS